MSFHFKNVVFKKFRTQSNSNDKFCFVQVIALRFTAQKATRIAKIIRYFLTYFESWFFFCLCYPTELQASTRALPLVMAKKCLKTILECLTKWDENTFRCFGVRSWYALFIHLNECIFNRPCIQEQNIQENFFLKTFNSNVCRKKKGSIFWIHEWMYWNICDPWNVLWMSTMNLKRDHFFERRFNFCHCFETFKIATNIIDAENWLCRFVDKYFQSRELWYISLDLRRFASNVVCMIFSHAERYQYPHLHSNLVWNSSLLFSLENWI